MRRLFLIAAMLAAFSLSALAIGTGWSASRVSDVQGDESANTAFDHLRTLAGDWSGTFEWSGARSDRGTLNAKYYVTGNGSAMVEDLIMGGAPTMTSVYHLDGKDLRMTHYCGARNQPRLKANRILNTKGVLDFSFVDITNLSSPDAPHVYGLEMRSLDADHITITFLFEGAGKRSRELIDLRRMRPSAA